MTGDDPVVEIAALVVARLQHIGLVLQRPDGHDVPPAADPACAVAGELDRLITDLRRLVLERATGAHGTLVGSPDHDSGQILVAARRQLTDCWVQLLGADDETSREVADEVARAAHLADRARQLLGGGALLQ